MTTRHGSVYLPAMLLVVSITAACITAVAQPLPDIMQPGVRVGADRFGVSLFLSLDGSGTVTDIKECNNLSSQQFIVAGNYGARWFDHTRTLRRSVDFAFTTPGGFTVAAKIIKASHLAKLFFFRQAAPAATYDSLVDSDGIEVWRTTYSPSPAGSLPSRRRCVKLLHTHTMRWIKSSARPIRTAIPPHISTILSTK